MRGRGSRRFRQERIAAREMPVSRLTEFRLRPCATKAKARLRVLRSYIRPPCETVRSDTQQKADVHENVDIRI
ncbi:hypothetical protein GCM10010378_20220 [Streptomyces viridochromogenes]